MTDASENKPRDHGKVFEARNSLLTELFEINHIRTIRHMIIAVIIIVCIDILVYDLTSYGKFNLEFDLFLWIFNGLGSALLFIWLPMELAALLIAYAAFYLYASKRNSVKEGGSIDRTFFVLYLVFLAVFILAPLTSISNLSVGCRIIILMEQTRLVMKVHAFVRSNVPKVINHKENTDSDMPKQVPCPNFSQYAYFVFAPTLIYRDNYPRSTGPIRWDHVINHIGEILVCMTYVYCLFDRICLPVYRTFKIRDMTLALYVQLVSMSIIPGGLILVNGWFSLLHSWQNMWAEMLRFSDRQFYTDWWNSTTFNMYYRKWNILVQDWLYAYIFKDIYSVLGNKHKAIANFGVIFISGIVHEYILSFTFGFFYPVVFVLFAGLGFVLLFIRVNNPNSAPWNIFIWICLFMGVGLNLSLFSLEWYARHNNECPIKFDSFVDYILPRSILCSI